MTLDRFDIRLLRIFVSIVEAGGFAAAQGELNLSLSTISSHISSLESRLGLSLCRRGRSGFRLTEEGRTVYEEAKRLFSTMEQFDGRMRGLKHRLNGTLRLGLVDNTITDDASRLNQTLARFTDKAPEAALHVVTRPPHELLRDVISGELDVAIASFPRATLGLEYVDLYVETQQFFCGEGHPLFSVPDEKIDIEDVRQHNIVARYYWNARDIKIFAISTPRAVVSDMEAEARLILSGRYLGYLPEHYAQRYVDAGRMRAVRPDLFRYRAPFQMAYEKVQGKAGLLPFFVKIVAEEFGVAKSARRERQLEFR